MRKTGAIIVVTAFALISASLAFSQPEGRGRMEERERAIEKVEMLRMWKLIETLDMDEKQAQKFFILANSYNDREKELLGERRRIEAQLRELLKNKSAPRDELGKLIRDFIRNQDEVYQNRKRFYEESSKILSLEQQAKLILFQSHFNREMFEIMREIREKKHPGRR